MNRDAATGQELPDSAIQRVTLVANNVHVYGIPPIASNRGFSASSWTAPKQPTAQQIFTARLRVIETSIESKIKADIVLEDGNTVRVQGEGGMKATLGIGFEDRSPALDFNIALAEMRKVLGMDNAGSGPTSINSKLDGANEPKQDFSLREGQKIHIQVGNRGRRQGVGDTATNNDDSSALFSIAPPPGSAAKAQSDSPSIAPPSTVAGKSAQELGFDDGEFGEFQ
ncbi:hypothetical protein LTR37_020920 [Vermiconidia calcicola]|uniref:Uncharacterized protein n=1 Tax=Vermiconidia calcicola TaxID=1690605 RepID=A0ACC3M9X0_9PEZI|nr:hypothetical protein LTR37_020920 [Vermiconidia calcicola]